jgi:glutaredoxin
MVTVQVYSRHGCHLCEAALRTLEKLQEELVFVIDKIFIDANQELEDKYGEQVPVILINREPHDFFKVDPERFKKVFATL